jgi:ATP-dependent Clp protease protease subunit
MMNLSRAVYLFGEINNENIGRVSKEIIQLHKDDRDAPIDLMVSSSGGSKVPGFAFYDLVQALKIPLRTFTSGDLSSMAIIVYLAGKTRYVGPNTSMLLHEGTRNFGNSFISFHEMLAATKELDLSHGNYQKIVATQTKMVAEQISQMMLENTILDASQMVELGVAHELWLPTSA